MEITRATEYAVRCVLHLALEPRDRVVPRREIARSREIPEQFLGKIAQRLARAGIIRIRQGARGGFELVAPPDRVTLLEVVEASERPIALNKCVMHPRVCSRSGICAAHRIWAEARRQLRDTLARTTFADLAAQEGPVLSCDGGAVRRPSPKARFQRRGDAKRGTPSARSSRLASAVSRGRFHGGSAPSGAAGAAVTPGETRHGAGWHVSLNNPRRR